jgi:predicted ArsR family transcriptional regulator
VKNVGAAPGAAETANPASVEHPAHPADRRTRQAVARLMLERGPITAADIADALNLTAAAVRRHLDVLIEAGEV